ncbi:M20 family metallopeptidase [Paenibacillus aceris]|uniref:Peptidase M20 domain-containing protein 2 n=1 Tax=Paenibacillus aceris TaxID=869555 RepID=A0ABS4HSX3_9BACL|nr:M20 family metallopeptidase [Paenibacillus aceris]MBP1961709.1 amidohydrolase [Paenibacillus aceris]NHW34432.1 M20 family metallopeptidase [Paenibacillus aceris]
MKSTITQTIDNNADRFKAISSFIGANPELGHEEFQASSRLTEELEYHGFQVERGALNIPTAFIATFDSGKAGPVVGFLAEYDALPELGHACGHHLICMMSIGAAIGLKSVIAETGGSIRVYGTPAEETKGAKVPMAEAGLFRHVDIALMAHPYYTYEKSGESLAMDAIQYEFFGRSAHAAAQPYEGINALDAVLQLFNSVNAMRQQTKSDARIHGIISEGGKAPNIIPDYAVAQFYVRSATRKYTDELVQKVLHCAEGAALQTGCTLKTSFYEYSYDELRTNETLSQVFTDQLGEMGIDPQDIEIGKDHGSLDLGNVSIQCPTIHPFVKVVGEKHMLHTKEFRDLALQGPALDAMIFTAKALAYTAYEVISSPELLQRIKAEFAAAKK